jgi:hypothetical protein
LQKTAEIPQWSACCAEVARKIPREAGGALAGMPADRNGTRFSGRRRTYSLVIPSGLHQALAVDCSPVDRRRRPPPPSEVTSWSSLLLSNKREGVFALSVVAEGGSLHNGLSLVASTRMFDAPSASNGPREPAGHACRRPVAPAGQSQPTGAWTTPARHATAAAPARPAHGPPHRPTGNRGLLVAVIGQHADTYWRARFAGYVLDLGPEGVRASVG